MKKMFIIAMMLACTVVIFAQEKTGVLFVKSQDELIKERRENKELAEAVIEAKGKKLAKKQAKDLKKLGWRVAAGTPAIEEQLAEVYIKSQLLNGNFPKYIEGRSSAKSSSYGMARKHALSRARVDLSVQMKTDIAGLIELTESNTEFSKGEVNTIAKMVETSQTLFQQSLGKTDVILDLYRELDNNTEAMIVVCYDGNLAMQTLLTLFEQDRVEIKKKLQEILDKE